MIAALGVTRIYGGKAIVNQVVGYFSELEKALSLHIKRLSSRARLMDKEIPIKLQGGKRQFIYKEKNNQSGTTLFIGNADSCKTVKELQ